MLRLSSETSYTKNIASWVRSLAMSRSTIELRSNLIFTADASRWFFFAAFTIKSDYRISNSTRTLSKIVSASIACKAVAIVFWCLREYVLFLLRLSGRSTVLAVHVFRGTLIGRLV